MDVGIALPNAVEGAAREQMREWARRAEAGGFSSLGTIDRVKYGNYEPLVALAAVAGSIVATAAKDAEAVRRYLAEYEEAGCDELVLCPSSSDPGKVDLLADAAGL